LDVRAGRELRVGHDRGRVRVDQHDVVALLEQHLARLHARVVELRRLADDDRPGAEDQDLAEVATPRHWSAPRGVPPRVPRTTFGLRPPVTGPALPDLVQEAVEEVEAVVRAGPGLGVVLDGASGDV